MCTSSCSDPWMPFQETSYDQGSICIYTARGPEQFGPELDEFKKVHSEIQLRCPKIDDTPLAGNKSRKDSIFCPRRIIYELESRDMEKEDMETEGVDRDSWAACHDAGQCTCTGDTWEVLRESTVTLTQRLKTEHAESPDGSRVPGDVVWGLAASHLITIEEMLRSYAPKGWSAIRKQASAGNERDRRLWANFIDDRNEVPRWVGIDVFMVALCVNPTKLDSRRVARGLPPSWMTPTPFGAGVKVRTLPSWDRLIDEDLDGLLAVPHPQKSGTGFEFLGGLAAKATDYEGFFGKLDKNVHAYTSSGSTPCDLVVAPDSDVAIGLTYDGYAITKYNGDSTTPNSDVMEVWWPPVGEGFFDVGANSLIAKPILMPAAQTFLDWASDDAMRTYRKTVMVTAIEDDAVPPGGYPEYDDFLSLLSSDTDVFRLADNRELWQYEWGCAVCNIDPKQDCWASPSGASAKRCDGGECSEDHNALWPDECADNEDTTTEMSGNTSTATTDPTDTT